MPDEPEPVELGRAPAAAPGRDVTIVAISRLVDESLAAAEQLAADGIEAEVIDPRTLSRSTSTRSSPRCGAPIGSWSRMRP